MLFHQIGYVKDLAAQYSLPLRVAYNKARGFFIQIPEAVLNLPPILPKSRISADNHSGYQISNSQNWSEPAAPLLSSSSVDNRPGMRKQGELPEVFIKVQIARGLINCTTAELVRHAANIG